MSKNSILFTEPFKRLFIDQPMEDHSPIDIFENDGIHIRTLADTCGTVRMNGEKLIRRMA